MASHSRNGNGSIDIAQDQRPLEEILSEFNQALDETLGDLNTFETHLEQHESTLNRLGEAYRDPRNVGITDEELSRSEEVILPDWLEALAIQNSHCLMIDSLTDAQVSMIRFWSTLDRREAEQRSNERRHRQEIENRRLEIQMSRRNESTTLLEQEVGEVGYDAMIESLERQVEQCEANIQSLQQIKNKYNDVMNEIERIKEAQDPIFARLLTVSPLIERNVDAISFQRKTNAILRATMNEQAGPSGQQQVANVEPDMNVAAEASGETEEKPELDEPEEEKVGGKGQRVSKKRSDSSDDD